MKKSLFFLLLVLTTPSWALLPPFYQSVKEVEEILANKALSSLSGEELLLIQKTEEGYLLETSRHRVMITVKKILKTSPGPASFSLEFGPLIEKTEEPS